MQRAVRYSKKREAILEAIRGTSCHPSAEWVYRQLKPRHPDLSLGTVYRNLAFFREQGLVRSVGTVQGQERFDAIVAPHSHFVCSCCGCVQDLPGLQLGEELDRSVSMQYGLAVERHELTFYGLCPSCLHQQNFKEETQL
ncbi:transcriptional repressor [Pseudoflavonifractor sp. 60]|uniref:Fur family transcriptional regulator n=1 Tax=Pseudoflavonifractor sp. 60 TaxID=2304576 RepID=UPI00136B90E3|nr:transcriptional repressor [Pseudoflavonifractor sp. 60]NBI66055.1 transcriptional repressor [Pseudoflavonifractor sp. 60]